MKEELIGVMKSFKPYMAEIIARREEDLRMQIITQAQYNVFCKIAESSNYPDMIETFKDVDEWRCLTMWLRAYIEDKEYQEKNID